MDVIKNIKTIRTQRGISHEAMAVNLGISQTAYTKIEREETKLTVDRLQKIAEILDVKIADLLELEPQSFHQDIPDNESVTAISHQKIENLYQGNREVYEKLIAAKDEQIALLKSLLEKR
ncbi:MAG: helix-turn-helix domain-containing protein [Prevotellaceae bacterium]|jgi:transcriptional regulator with XRE-family HTH domain|nr:helix-turn-helix domain-containing protein [Prevotellaceae bacterium]